MVDYTSQDFVAEVGQATYGHGVDVVLDVIGGDYVQRNVRVSAVGGHIIQVGVMGGGKAEVNVGDLLPKRLSLTGTVLRGRPVEEKIAVSRRCEHDLLPLFDAGTLRPVIDRRMSLWEVAEAHELVAANATVGKVVLQP